MNADALSETWAQYLASVCEMMMMIFIIALCL